MGKKRLKNSKSKRDSNESDNSAKDDCTRKTSEKKMRKMLSCCDLQRFRIPYDYDYSIKSRRKKRKKRKKEDISDKVCKIPADKKEDSADCKRQLILTPSVSARKFPHCPSKSKLECSCKLERKRIPYNLKTIYTKLLARKRKPFKEEQEARYKDHCKEKCTEMPPIEAQKQMKFKVEAKSAQVKEAKVMPKMSSGELIVPKTKKELRLRRPRSGIVIGGTDESKLPPEEDLIFPKPGGGKMLKDVFEKQPEIQTEESARYLEDEYIGMEGYGEDEGEDRGEGRQSIRFELKMSKMLRRKVSKISKTTSIQSKDFKIEEEDTVSKIIQKYKRDSEQKRYTPTKRKVKRGTFQSHSYTVLAQPTLKSFFFGVKLGTIHQGDENFPPEARDKQGICVPIAAYCLAVIKHPDKWTQEDIDAILESGSQLYLSSLGQKHIHGLEDHELAINELAKYCYIACKKVRFQISEPVVCGSLRSTDKRVYNITKALNIFFQRKTAGLFVTDAMKIAIWKDRHYYFFDGMPRTVDLYSTENGSAMMAYFYDLLSVITVLLEKSGLHNPEFIIYEMRAIRVLDQEAKDTVSKDKIDEHDKYQVINDQKAVRLGSFDLADKCFGFSRDKQAVTIAVAALVYAKITPPSAWIKATIDKIMIIGNQLFLELVECDDMVAIKLEDLPAMFTIGPYMVEIYIYPRRHVELMFKKQKCMLEPVLEEFFEKNTNAVLQIDKYTLAVWKNTLTNMYYMFDPYSRNSEGLKSRCGEACASMYTSIEALVETIAKNFDNKDFIFYVHAMKVLKINRDPESSYLFPPNMKLNDYPIEKFKKCKIRRCKRPATKMHPVTIDPNVDAVVSDEFPNESILEVDSNIKSLNEEQLPPMVSKWPSRCKLRPITEIPDEDIVVDLDSPSLSETQIEPPRPKQPDEDQPPHFVDLGSYDLLMEDYLLACAMEGEEFDFGGEGGEGAGEGEDQGEGGDWYMAGDAMTQVHSYSLDKAASKISAEVNTDLTFFCIPKEELPAPIRTKILEKRKKYRDVQETADDQWDEALEEREPVATLSEELAKPSNFLDLPDNSQIILGTKNMVEYGNDVEFMAPFICIIAAVVARKYQISSWSKEIIDYILSSGAQLYNSSDTRYDQVYRLEIPRIVLGRTDFAVRVCYVYDSYLKPKVLEMALKKFLFTKSNCGILATPCYACLIYYRNNLFYLYDGFACNQVGLGVGPSNEGVACMMRFKDIHSLVARILYNKSKRETDENVEYNRFVLSAVFIKKIPKADEEKQKEIDDEMKSELYGGDAEDRYGDDDMGEEMNVRKKPRPPIKEERKKAKNLVGWQFVNSFYRIEGSCNVGRGDKSSKFLEADYFVCLCANLMLLNHPLAKWDTRRVDQVVQQGKLVFTHAVGRDIGSKKCIKNVLIDDYFFSVIAKETEIDEWQQNKNLKMGMNYLIGRGIKHFIVQFPSTCVCVTLDMKYHYIFNPNEKEKAAWIRFPTFKKLTKYLRSCLKNKDEEYHFHQFEITTFIKAPKHLVIKNRVQRYKMIKEPKLPKDPQIQEEVAWAAVDPIPWSKRMFRERTQWHEWNEEITGQLWSLYGNLHQNDGKFEAKIRGKQTFGVLVVAIAMTEIYELSEWTPTILDNIVVNGTKYFQESLENQEIEDEEWMVELEDLAPNCVIFPFQIKVKFVPFCDGTIFTIDKHQFNLAKAIRFFFNDYERRYGIMIVAKRERRRIIAFGKLSDQEYFLFDTEAFGTPIFPDNSGASYILRTTTIRRLLECMVHILRSGDFFIFDVGISPLKPLL